MLTLFDRRMFDRRKLFSLVIKFEALFSSANYSQNPACGSIGLCTCTFANVFCNGGLFNVPELPDRVFSLNLNNNSLTNIPAEAMQPSLSFFEANNNLITALPQPALPIFNLSDFFMAGNALRNLSRGEFAAIGPNLTSIAIPRNVVTWVSDGAFAGLPLLRNLSMHNNPTTCGVAENGTVTCVCAPGFATDPRRPTFCGAEPG